MFLNVSFVNKSLFIEEKTINFPTYKTFTYQAGITSEYEPLHFYVNQSGLSDLPDGNYTLWRRIKEDLYVENPVGEELYTNITVTAGIIAITYANFSNTQNGEISYKVYTSIFALTLFSLGIIVYRKQKPNQQFKQS